MWACPQDKVASMADTVEFAKMNGLGNKIPGCRYAWPHRSRHAGSCHCTVLLIPPRISIRSWRSMIRSFWAPMLYRYRQLRWYARTGLRQWHGCVVQALAAETGRKAFTFQTLAGILNAEEHQDGTISVDMGKPVFQWDKIPLSEEFYDTSASNCRSGRSITGPAFARRHVHGQSPCRVLGGSRSDVLRLERFGPLLENHRCSRRKPISRWRRSFHRLKWLPALGAWCWPHTGLRFGCLFCRRLGARTGRTERKGGYHRVFKPRSRQAFHRMA